MLPRERPLPPIRMVIEHENDNIKSDHAALNTNHTDAWSHVLLVSKGKDPEGIEAVRAFRNGHVHGKICRVWGEIGFREK